LETAKTPLRGRELYKRHWHISNSPALLVITLR
jgi:hypothetical protein